MDEESAGRENRTGRVGYVDGLPTGEDGQIVVDDVSTVIAVNEAYLDVVKQMARQVEEAIEENRTKQREVIMRQRAMKEDLASARRKVPVQIYLPPYFKDEHGMCPPLSEEAKKKLEEATFDPLEKEERKWTQSDIKKLREAVNLSLLDAKLRPLKDRRDLLKEKIAATDVTTTDKERKEFRAELDSINRKIDWEKEHYKDDDMNNAETDYSFVDWALISTSVFNGMRSQNSLRLRWLNELSPRWNQESWKKTELLRLKELRESSNFISWNVLANQLATRRSPWQCFEKYRSTFWNASKSWTQEEDEKLSSLVNMLRVNGKVQWEKVTYFMPGRNRQQVRMRYMRTLDENIRHGRWTKEEDLVLLSAVRNLGAKEWQRVSKQVPGRTDGQCRDRWINVLSKNVETRFWTCYEDEILIYLIGCLGRGQWARVSSFMEDKDARLCRRRYTQLISAKLKLVALHASEEVRLKLFGTTEKDTGDISRVLCDELNGHQSAAVSRTVQTFKDFGRLTKKVEDPKEFRDSVIKFTEEQANPSLIQKSMKERYKWESKINKDEMFAEIEKIKAKHAQKDIPRVDILDLLQPTDEDRNNFVKTQKGLLAAKNLRACVPANKRNISSLVARMSRSKVDEAIDENMESWANSVFDLSLPEEERAMYVTEALCEEVRVLDQLEWQKSLSEPLARDARQIVNYVIGSTIQKASKVVEAQRKGEAVPADCTLPPNTHTLMMASTFECLRPQLNRLASSYFNEVVVSDNESGKNNLSKASLQKRNFSIRDRMQIELPEEITNSSEYQLYKAYLRALLFEPMKINLALERSEMISDRRAKVHASKKIRECSRKRKYRTGGVWEEGEKDDDNEERQNTVGGVAADEVGEQNEPPNKKTRTKRQNNVTVSGRKKKKRREEDGEEWNAEGNGREEMELTDGEGDSEIEGGEIDFDSAEIDLELYEEDEREELDRARRIDEIVEMVVDSCRRGVPVGDAENGADNNRDGDDERREEEMNGSKFLGTNSENAREEYSSLRNVHFDPDMPGPSHR